MCTVLYRYGHEKQDNSNVWKRLEFDQDSITVEEFLFELRKKKFRRADRDITFEVYDVEGTRIEDLKQHVSHLIIRRYPPHPRITVRGLGSVVHWMM